MHHVCWSDQNTQPSASLQMISIMQTITAQEEHIQNTFFLFDPRPQKAGQNLPKNERIISQLPIFKGKTRYFQGG